MKRPMTTLIMCLAVSGVLAGNLSDGIRVDLSPEKSFLWCTATAGDVQLQWDWPADATRATLTAISGRGRESLLAEFASPTTSWVWTVAAPGKDEDEDVVTLRLSFFAAGDKELAGKRLVSVPLGIVRGGTSDAFRVVGSLASPAWREAPARQAVIPVDRGLTDVTADGAPLMPGGCAWAYWRPRSGGTHVLAAQDAAKGPLAEEVDATLPGLWLFFR